MIKLTTKGGGETVWLNLSRIEQCKNVYADDGVCSYCAVKLTGGGAWLLVIESAEDIADAFSRVVGRSA